MKEAFFFFGYGFPKEGEKRNFQHFLRIFSILSSYFLSFFSHKKFLFFLTKIFGGGGGIYIGGGKWDVKCSVP